MALIDKDKLFTDFEDAKWLCNFDRDDIAEELLLKAPEIDPVHAAGGCYCRECENWHTETAWCKEHSYFVDAEGNPCTPAENGEWKTFPPDYFCADGRRKEVAE